MAELIQQPLFPFNSHGKTCGKQAHGARVAGQDILAEARSNFDLWTARILRKSCRPTMTCSQCETDTGTMAKWQIPTARLVDISFFVRGCSVLRVVLS